MLAPVYPQSEPQSDIETKSKPEQGKDPPPRLTVPLDIATVARFELAGGGFRPEAGHAAVVTVLVESDDLLAPWFVFDAMYDEPFVRVAA